MADPVIRKETKTDEIIMVFGLENDKNTTLKINDPKANLTLTEVTQVGEALLAKDAIIVGGSEISELKDSYHQTTTKLLTEWA